jgi:hypothetical protein
MKTEKIRISKARLKRQSKNIAGSTCLSLSCTVEIITNYRPCPLAQPIKGIYINLHDTKVQNTDIIFEMKYCTLYCH